MSHYAEECYELYNEIYPIARKEHVCCACEEVIAVGVQYARCTVVYDGEVSVYKRCARCQAIHLHLRKKGTPDDLWPDESLACGESYADHWNEEPPPEIAALAFWRPGDPLPTTERTND